VTPVVGANEKASAPPAARANAPAQYTRLRIVDDAARGLDFARYTFSDISRGENPFFSEVAKRFLFVGTRNTVWFDEKNFLSCFGTVHK